MKNILLPIISVIISANLFAQNITGSVSESKDGKNLPLPGASVFWLGTFTGTTTNADGSFSIEPPETFPGKLVISFVGLKGDTITVNNASTPIKAALKSSLKLDEVEVTARQQSTAISYMSPINVETLNTAELRKAACCNLAESFETNASVDVNYTDAVSGARQIQMLGLDGTYTQILNENMPGVRGLAASSGLGFIPGTWIKSIEVSKGAGSVVNGYESTTGQINVEYHKPEDTERVFINGYVNHLGRYEANVHLAERLNEKWSTLLFTHANTVNRKIDMTGDGFLNTPLQKQINVFNRWKYDSKNFLAQFGVKGLLEERIGGQLDYNPSTDYLAGNRYGIGINSKQFEAFSKAAFVSTDRPVRSLGFISTFKHYEQNSFFGLRTYDGKQNSGYFNLIYQDFINTTDHKFKTGASLQTDQYNESLNDSAFSRREIVPGVFGEYQYEIEQKVTVLAGLRGDYHNLYGFFPTPRLHFKYHFAPKTVARLSAGRGFRVANIFAENSAVLASSRAVFVEPDLRPEIGWSYGTSFTHKICYGDEGVVFNLDFYRTEFTNRIIVDFDQSLNEIHFYNLKGQSFSNSFQAEVIVEASKQLEFKTAYKWYDVRNTYNGELLPAPLISNHRLLFNTTYFTKFDKWKFDFTAKWYGPTRIPAHGRHDGINHIHLAERSPDYFVLLGQITRSFKNFDIYFGAENITNTMQHNPVLGYENPFGQGFDASLVWGPLMGRVIYSGFRFKIK
jgi:outer membrane receptor for ferrienterochelin and colicins